MADKKISKSEKPKAGKRLKLRRAKTAPDTDTATKKTRRFRVVPGFMRNAWAEIRQVTWPGRKETARLTVAVLIFSIIFGAFVAALDYGLDKLFKEVILK